MSLAMTEYRSPIGALILVGRAGVLHVLAFPEQWAEHRARLERAVGAEQIESVAVLPAFSAALDGYFAGDLAALDNIRAEARGTPFQRRVWQHLRTIAPGHTTSYGAMARAIGAPAASRAVGAANGANPISIVLPCHRVVGSSGDMTGYGGGLERKRWLLAHERRFAAGAETSLPLLA